jgi:hypothetical protein
MQHECLVNSLGGLRRANSVHEVFYHCFYLNQIFTRSIEMNALISVVESHTQADVSGVSVEQVIEMEAATVRFTDLNVVGGGSNMQW